MTEYSTQQHTPSGRSYERVLIPSGIYEGRIRDVRAVRVNLGNGHPPRAKLSYLG